MTFILWDHPTDSDYESCRCQNVSSLLIDIDECTNGSHDCDMNANCTNTEGTFTCQCITGYYGNGYNCTGEFVFLSTCTYAP